MRNALTKILKSPPQTSSGELADSGSLDSLENISEETSPSVSTPSGDSVIPKSSPKKRNMSSSPSCSTPKRLNLDSSLTDQLEYESSPSDPHWVPLLFQFLDILKHEVNSFSRKLDKLEDFKIDISNRVDSVEKEKEILKGKIGSIENNTKDLKQKVCSLDGLASKFEVRMTSIENEKVMTKNKVDELEKSVEFSSGVCDDLKKEIGSLTLQNKKLLKTVEDLCLQVDANEQHNRSECLLLHGVPENDKESPSQSVDIFAKNITQTLGIEIRPEYIRRAHRLGQRKPSGKPRPIIARFWNSNLRNDVYANKKKCKETTISITENLTRRRVQLKNDAEKKYGARNVWSREGRIFARDTATENVLTIVS